MDANLTTALAAPRLEQGAEMLIFGLGGVFRDNAGIPAMWGRFVPHLGHIVGQKGHVTYGVMVPHQDDAGTFDYICGVEVSAFPAEPAAFTRLRIPPRTYAVFVNSGHISLLARTMRAIWEHGLSSAGLRPVYEPTFERYDERFDAGTGLGGLEIWVPVAS